MARTIRIRQGIAARAEGFDGLDFFWPASLYFAMNAEHLQFGTAFRTVLVLGE